MASFISARINDLVCLSAIFLGLAVANGGKADHLFLNLDQAPQAATRDIMVLTNDQQAGISPSGMKLEVDSVSLLKDGKPWTPVMGEFHFARYPAESWKQELLKMKAGGVDIVASYIFWIHHEARPGEFDWEGRRDLRRFVLACQEAGLDVMIRIGPWCHGEARNGGLPEWTMPFGKKLRTTDPVFLSHVQRLYEQIAEQVEGLLFKDGGPIVGLQVDNEYRGPAEYLLTLKKMAQEVGLHVPYYTRTAWPALTTPMPEGEMLPMYGAYVEGFWNRSLEKMPRKYWQAFSFSHVRNDSNVATDHFGQYATADPDHGVYPNMTCELGGGMVTSYHRRILIDSRDIESSALVKLGSGSNLLGYYMYHGGVNPMSPSPTFTYNEARATHYTSHNDMPVKDYDFQAPLGAFGQPYEHYHGLRKLHLFVKAFGAELSDMQAVLPAKQPKEKSENNTLRWAVRQLDGQGYLFVNNYQRGMVMPAKEGVQFSLAHQGKTRQIPSVPVDIPKDSFFFWPFGTSIAGLTLDHATAQPITRLTTQIDHSPVETYFFAQTAGLPVCFVFEDQSDEGFEIQAISGESLSKDHLIHVQDVEPSFGRAIAIKQNGVLKAQIVVLSEEASRRLWVGEFEHETDHVTGRQTSDESSRLTQLIWSDRDLTVDGDSLLLAPVASSVPDLNQPVNALGVKAPGVHQAETFDGVLFFPGFKSDQHALQLQSDLDVMEPADDLYGVFQHFQAKPRPVQLNLSPLDSFLLHDYSFELLTEARPARTVELPEDNVTPAPDERDWQDAMTVSLSMPEFCFETKNGEPLIAMRVHYVGDAARLYCDGRLMADQFYNGRPWYVAPALLDGANPQGKWTLAILPLKKETPLYLADMAQEAIADAMGKEAKDVMSNVLDQACVIDSIDWVQQAKTKWQLQMVKP